MTPEEFGLSDWFKDQIDPVLGKKFTVARVVAVHKGWSDISDGSEVRPAKSTGRLRHEARSNHGYLTVGDWVLVKKFDEGDFAVIHSVLKRKTELKRKTVEKKVCFQLIAANIDTAFVVHTLDKGYNLRKLERYLSIVHDSGITPVVVMTKKDLLDEETLTARLAEVHERIPNVKTIAISNVSGDGMELLHELLIPTRTYCLIGASGVGKTTLINSILGEEDAYFTLPVREKDGKGIHSTTWRELITLENESFIIDTPGMRELGHLDSSVGIGETFDEITALVSNCRFRDCAHVNTDGCAVMAAVEAGDIAKARYENFIRMRAEAAASAKALREQGWRKK